MKHVIPLIACLLLLCALPANARDYWEGPPTEGWIRDESGSTFAHWNFQSLDFWFLPEAHTNPWVEPIAEFVSGSWQWDQWECPPELDASGTVTGWHCTSAEGGTISMNISATEDPLGTQWIYIQITSTAHPTEIGVVGYGPSPSGYASGSWPTGRPPVLYPGPAPFDAAWYTFSLGLYLQPGPQGQAISLGMPQNAVIDQIVVDTFCTELPLASPPTSWGRIKALYGHVDLSFP